MDKLKKIPVSGLIETICSWKGCKRMVFIGETLPAAWKCLVVAPGSLFKKQNLLSADVDGVLCPEHFTELLSLLKVGQSPRTK